MKPPIAIDILNNALKIAENIPLKASHGKEFTDPVILIRLVKSRLF